MASLAPSLGSSIGKLLLQSSLAPFLYQTKTLLRPSTGSKMVSTLQDSRVERPKRTQSNQSIPIKGQSKSEIPVTVSSRPNALRQRSPSSKKDRVDAVPFEDVVASWDPIEKLKGSTMTPKELAKFENLMRKTATANSIIPKRQRTDQNALQSSPTKPDFPEPLRDLAREVEDLRNKASEEMDSKTKTGLDTATSVEHDEYFLQVMDRMDHSSSDVSLWNILQTDVLSRVVALQKQLSAQQISQPREAQKLSKLTRSVPHLLVHFMRLIQTTFQGSSFSTALLPSLKNLGPSGFALTATTALYNEHMRVLYKQYSDLDGIAQSLAEMDQEVYEFDKGTQDLLASILNHAHASMRGHNGPGQQALWLTDRKTRSLAKLERWNQTVEMRVQSAALRKARESSTGVTGE